MLREVQVLLSVAGEAVEAGYAAASVARVTARHGSQLHAICTHSSGFWYHKNALLESLLEQKTSYGSVYTTLQF